MTAETSCCGSSGQNDQSKTAIDPVCGMNVDTTAGKPFFDYMEETYHFCSTGCRNKFETDPEFYLTGANKRKVDYAPKDVKYTCPMHPEIIEDKLVDCPLCGMALEPMGAPMDGPNPELVDFTRRFWISIGLTVPILALTMLPMIGIPLRDWLGERISAYLELLFAAPIVLWAAKPFFVRGYGSIINKSPNMWTLIAIGVGVAFIYSTVATLFPGIFPPEFQLQSGAVPVYFESAAVIITLVFLGQIMELKARERTGEAIKALMGLTPETAMRINDNGTEREVPLENILPGDRVRIRPGERIPVDGHILEGSSDIDESLVSGEPLPVSKTAGARVTGGTLNGSGGFVMMTDQIGTQTMLGQIVEMVSTAQRSRAPIQAIADKVAAYFVPAVVGIAILSFVIWSIFGPDPRFIFALLSSVSVLIIACPCALGLATPMSITTAAGRGAEHGILIKDANALEKMNSVNAIVIDKTGTLTEGKPTVSDIHLFSGTAQEDALVMTASLEKGSEHPLAKAILKKAEVEKITLAEVENFKSVSGKGISGVIGSKIVLVGNSRFMTENDIDLSQTTDLLKRFNQAGQAHIYLACDGQLTAIFAITDPIKETAKKVVANLKSRNVRIVMATGDQKAVAERVALELGIDEVHAECLPAEKLTLVDSLKKEGFVVAVAGDGVNDAPALAKGDVGIAMGTGSDVSMESAGITLLHGDITGIDRAFRLAEGCISNIRQNLILAFGYNALCVPIAAGILYPVTGTLLSPMIAAAAMSLSSVSVIANALRLKKLKL
ncbi:heavy metal translocating P-type ATPase [Sneathiella sp. P13V-1]|uniref:heavy metal translocating P-type ATPase n=1 Tax=Sneathiella sp. P13V-1 TaxID=2697366 RepID=UPI00187BA6DE|nr:heavy metal translocating P-type ATPase [Sneathiella sp. P13V-1]MBE7636732.1 heavy metal translocating P-type ATPase [Sneathiella sp. P13V-1]